MSAGTGSGARSNPFPGLRPFRSDENHLFFGREEQAAALLQLLRTNRFLAIVGTSGSGKSSLVRAGLIPELHGGTMARAGSSWEVVLLRPGGRPLENLARALIAGDLYDRDDPGTLPRLRATLSRSRFGLVEAVKQSDAVDAGANLLVVVDQFEELFRFRQQGTDSEEAAAAFVNLLLTSSTQTERRIYVALTMRSDYLGDCSEIPGLAEAVNRGEYLIPRLMRDQKRDAIEKPIGVGGARISPLLVQRLLNDIGDDPDQLPVLQHAMMRMWDVWSQAGDRDRPIDICDLEATGGLASALSRHADEIYEGLPDIAHRAACERVFKALTEKGADNRGIRRPTPLGRLEAIAASDHATITLVLDAFRRPGVTFIMPDIDTELTDRTVVDLSHESLMRGWQRLRSWVEEEAQSARIFHRLSDTASLWREGKASLFRDPDLQIGLCWREDEQPNDAWAELYGGRLDLAVEFLEKSREEARAEEEAREARRQRELAQARRIAEVERQQAAEQRRSARILKWLACGLGAVAVLALAAFLFALEARKKAQNNAELARERAAETDKARSVLRDQLYVADMNRIARASAEGRSRQVVQLLNAHRPEPGELDLRGFEWYYWWRASHLDEWRYRESLAPYNAMVVSPDGKWIAVLGYQTRVDVFDASRKLLIHKASAASQTFSAGLSHDGAILAAAGYSDKVRLFNTSDWSQLRDLQLPRSAEIVLAFSPTAAILATGEKGQGEITLWDTVKWEPSTYRLDGVSIGSNLAFSTDGSTLAFGSNSGKFPVVLWDVESRNSSRTLLGHEAAVISVAWSPDGRFLAAGDSDETVRLWNSELEEVGVLRALGPVRFLAFSPDSKYLAGSSSKDNAVRVWLTESKQLFSTIRGHRQPVTALVFVGDENTLWTASQDGYIKTWDLRHADRTETVNLGQEAEGFSPVGMTSEAAGQEFLMHRRGAKILRRDLAGTPDGGDARPSSTLWDDGEEYEVVALSDDGRFLATYSRDGRLQVRDLERGSLSGQQRVELNWDEGPTKVSVSRNGDIAVLVHTNWSHGRLAFCNLKSGEIRKKERGMLLEADLSPDGEKLVIGLVFNIELWNWRSEDLLASFSEIGPVKSAAFSPDGSTLAMGFWDNNIYTYSVQTHQRESILQGHGREVTALAFSPDGRTLVSGSQDGTLRLWSAGSGNLLSTLTGHRGTVNWVMFAPDGYSILSTSTEDDGIKIWRRAAEAEVAQDVRDVEEILGLDGRSNESQREWAQALTMLNDAIGIRTIDPQLLAWRGRALTKLGYPLEALEDYRRAVELGLEEASSIRGAAASIGLRPWVAGSDRKLVSWRCRTEASGRDEDWKSPAYDDSGWKSGTGPFGNSGEPTRWNQPEIWLRREFELENAADGNLVLLASVDDAAEIYLNGVLASRVNTPTAGGGYERLPCKESAVRSLRRGTNVMAVYCRNIERAGRIDCGLYTAEPGADEKVISFLSRALEARPRSAPLLEARSQAYAMQGDWKRAASDYLSLTELNPDNLQTWMRAATLFARAGETARYQEVFQKMLMRIGSIEDIARADNAEKVAKTGLIMATPDSILESATKLALQANRVAATKAGQAWVLPWSQLTLGWAEFRNGEYAKAITLCENSLAHGRLADRDALAKVILAMAHFHVNEVQEAQRALDEADQILEDNLDLAARFRVSNWHDLIICSLLREEARDLFQRGS